MPPCRRGPYPIYAASLSQLCAATLYAQSLPQAFGCHVVALVAKPWGESGQLNL